MLDTNTDYDTFARHQDPRRLDKHDTQGRPVKYTMFISHADDVTGKGPRLRGRESPSR